jgi:hypothetical protein
LALFVWSIKVVIGRLLVHFTNIEGIMREQSAKVGENSSTLAAVLREMQEQTQAMQSWARHPSSRRRKR